MQVWKVGELAKRTGLTVRTLHHYDAIGLLSPSHRSGSGYRLYTENDIARLQQIVSLRQLGFSLAEIRDCLANPELSLLRVLRLHLSRLGEQIERQQRLRTRLQALAEHVRAAETISAAELFETIEAITMFEKYYTPEQLEQLAERRRQLGEERIRAVEAEWPELIAQVRAEMERGTDPASKRVQQLARRWRELVEEFTGGDPGIERSLRALYRQEGAALAEQYSGVPDSTVSEYIGSAIAASKKPD